MNHANPMRDRLRGLPMLIGVPSINIRPLSGL
jgi:hypothetical protein